MRRSPNADNGWTREPSVGCGPVRWLSMSGCLQTSLQPELRPWDPHDRREQTSRHCPLTSTCTLWCTCTCTYTDTITYVYTKHK